MTWHVIYTRPRNEKKVTEQLERLGIIVYCPLVTQIKQWSDRKRKVQTPLIPSYVFVNVIENERERVLQVHGVLRFVFWLGKPAVIGNDEMELMRNTINQPHSEVFLTALRPGEMVALEQGVFKGQKAMIEQVSNTKLHLYLPSIGAKLIVNKDSL